MGRRPRQDGRVPLARVRGQGGAGDEPDDGACRARGHSRSSLWPSLRSRGRAGRRRPVSARRGRGRGGSPGRALPGSARGLRRARELPVLQRQQDHHDGRRRHGAHPRRGAGAARPRAHDPGARRRDRVRPRGDGVQLPADQYPGGARSRAARAARWLRRVQARDGGALPGDPGEQARHNRVHRGAVGALDVLDDVGLALRAAFPGCPRAPARAHRSTRAPSRTRSRSPRGCTSAGCRCRARSASPPTSARPSRQRWRPRSRGGPHSDASTPHCLRQYRRSPTHPVQSLPVFSFPRSGQCPARHAARSSPSVTMVQ